MLVRIATLIFWLGLIGMVPAAITTPVAAQTEESEAQSAERRQDVATFIAGLSPAQQAALGRIGDGLGEFDWKAFHLLLIGFEPDARNAALARLERLNPAQLIAFRRELESTDPVLWPEVLEVAGASPEVRNAHSVARIEAQLLPGEKAEMAAFLAQRTPRQADALLQVTDNLRGFGERGLLLTFLARLAPQQQTAMISLIEHMTAGERATFADELHDNGYEVWPLLADFRMKVSEFEMLRIMFGFLPCRPIGVDGLERCGLPEGTEAFIAQWRSTPILSRHPVTDDPGSDVGSAPTPTVATAALPALSQPTTEIESRFEALLGEGDSPDKLDLQTITASLSNHGERFRFMAFFTDLTDAERAAFVSFVGESGAENIAAALHQVPPDDWPVLTRFLALPNQAYTIRIVRGYLPCLTSRRDGSLTCQVPGSARDFLAIWPIHPVIRRETKVTAYGVRAKPSDARWQAQIFKFGKSALRPAADQAAWETGLFGRPLQDFEWQQVCGGVYIEPHWILTAAHCTLPPNEGDPPEAFLTSRRVRLGTIDIGSGGGSEWRIDGVVRHADADPHRAYLGNDIALLHIVGPVAGPVNAGPVNAGQFNKGQTLIPTPIRRPGPGDPGLRSGATVELTGWGVAGIAARTRQTRTDDQKPQVPVQSLQLARLQFWQPDYCNRDPRFAGKGYKVGPGQICAGSLDNQTACYLDSGGPLVRYEAAPENGTPAPGPMLVGLVSFGIGCGNAHAPSGFVDVRYFDDWIRRAKARFKPGKFVMMR